MNSRTVLLIHPPVVKPCEPPAGVARLAAFLRFNAVRCTVLDASLEGLLHLIEAPPGNSVIPSDRWTTRALRNRIEHLTVMQSPATYRQEGLARYSRAVSDLNRALEFVSRPLGSRVSLANFTHDFLAPVRSADLLRAADEPEANPFFPYFSHRLRDILEWENPSIVGLSLNFLNQALCAFAMMGFLRREAPGLRLVVGGGLATSWMSQPEWRDPFCGLVDEWVAGPGEERLLELVNGQKAYTASGMGGTPISQLAQPPDYTLLPIHRSFSPGFILPYAASSGCYWNRCAFCPEKAEGSPYHFIPPDRAATELATLTAQTKPVLLHLLDNALRPDLMHAMTLSPPGAPWYGFVRFTRHLTDPDFCRALRRSGCVMLKLGVESGDQAVLDRERKGIDLNTASLALRTLKDAGIATYVYLLFGTPSEDEAAARKTLDFTVRHAPYIDFLNLAIFNLPLTSPDGRGLEQHAHYEGDLSLYTGFVHPMGWHRGMVRHFAFQRISAKSSFVE